MDRTDVDRENQLQPQDYAPTKAKIEAENMSDSIALLLNQLLNTIFTSSHTHIKDYRFVLCQATRTLTHSLALSSCCV